MVFNKTYLVYCIAGKFGEFSPQKIWWRKAGEQHCELIIIVYKFG